MVSKLFKKPLWCIFRLNNKEIARGSPVGDQWLFDSIIPQKTNLVSTVDQIQKPLDVWHQRFAHLNTDRIKEIHANRIVDGLYIKEGGNVNCKVCVLSKMAATPSYSRELRARTPGDIIHADLEFMSAKSFSGAQISLKLVDEFSNYVWVYALTSKESTGILNLWQHLCAEFRNQFGLTVKALHSDNGTEFVNQGMSSFNDANGIHHHLTVPYRHEMNGRIERMN
ncbi:hypothetical protein ACEPAG_2614 [Sanghuangporus baumii]